MGFVARWALFGALAAAAALLHALLLVPRLAEPPDGKALRKLKYAKLPTPPRLAVLAVLALASGAATAYAPADQRGLWLAFGGGVLPLVWVDALTTWLPRQMTHLAMGETAAGLGVGLALSGNRVALAQGVALGALASWAFFYAVWRVSRQGIGYGDVLLAPMVGALGGAQGMEGWFATMLAGALAALAWGGLTRRKHPAPGTRSGFAYGPGMWLGPYAAIAWALTA
jgi:leader peptidase (prepilin peptidase)/N-methyltransferase